jgi:hypothetical protein
MMDGWNFTRIQNKRDAREENGKNTKRDEFEGKKVSQFNFSHSLVQRFSRQNLMETFLIYNFHGFRLRC